VNRLSASPSIPIPLRFSACFSAWCKARKGKKPSANKIAFEARWLDSLTDLYTVLRVGEWQPARTVCFVVTHPKTREIHAPDFADRVVHHILVERLEKLYEPRFIYDSFANRQEKGSHAAVKRLQAFMRMRDSGNSAWYLQLDIHNYFNSIYRPTLYAMLCKRLEQAQRSKELPIAHVQALRSLCHKLLANPISQYVRSPEAAAKIPPHKRLCHAKRHCGLPVGNLTSQFFANVYLDALDQFVKHVLKVRHYVRYVDDFVLLGDSPAQLKVWQAQIEMFLHQTLHLKVKEGVLLQNCVQGVDFLGYRVFAHHLRVRPRVVRHCLAKLAAWHAKHPLFDKVTVQQANLLHATLASYWGHFAHANSVRLRQMIFDQNPWLEDYFVLLPDGSLKRTMPARWQVLRRKTIASLFPHSHF
jgi:retron-type reverse transcriptase